MSMEKKPTEKIPQTKKSNGKKLKIKSHPEKKIHGNKSTRVPLYYFSILYILYIIFVIVGYTAD